MIAAQERRPLALIEVGPSAGLCLLPDLYSYSYDGAPPLGTGSPLLQCSTTGNPPLPTALPEIAWRAGVDLNPLDGTDPETVEWLRALVWPGQTGRLRQLDEALETLHTLKSGAYGSTAGAPALVEGDLNDRIGELVAAAPEGSVPVVFHSAVLMYLDEADRKRFAADGFGDGLQVGVERDILRGRRRRFPGSGGPELLHLGARRGAVGTHRPARRRTPLAGERLPAPSVQRAASGASRRRLAPVPGRSGRW